MLPPAISTHRGIVIVHPPQVEHHRWTAQGYDQPDQGLIPLDGPTLAVLRQLRWRKTPRDHRQLWLALTVAMLLHAIFVAVIWREMRPRVVAAVVPVRLDDVLQVRFITHASPPVTLAPPLPATPPPAPRPRVLVKPREPLSKDAMTVQLPTPKPASTPALRLFDQNGQPLLPAAATSAPAAPEPDYVQHMPQGDTQIMHDTDIVKYKATRFDAGWGKGNAVDSALQKAVDKTTVQHTFNLPGGVRIHCGVSLAMLAGGCGGDPPSPPSAKDGDERLSMAPAKPLAADPHPAQPPSVEACIAMYRAGKPLAWGCPIDTPNRAVDAELHERAVRASTQP